MSRQKCCRIIGLVPEATVYRPEGPINLSGEDVVLSLDEFEAIRLADFAGLYQEDAAGRMNVSRQTFGRIIESAHRKIADVLINGRALRIEGGNVSVENRLCLKCKKCKKSIDCVNKFKEGQCPRRLSESLQK